MIRCIARRMSGGTGHEHISHIRWLDESTGQQDTSATAQMVDFVKKSPSCTVITRDRTQTATCVGVRSNQHTEWLQTYANKRWTDNLLALPTF